MSELDGTSRTATLKNRGCYTIFSYNDRAIRFRTSKHLERYTKILEWDHGYLVVMAKYDNSPEEEEDYIDLVPILKNLYIDPEEFLCNIKEVCLSMIDVQKKLEGVVDMCRAHENSMREAEKRGEARDELREIADNASKRQELYAFYGIS